MDKVSSAPLLLHEIMVLCRSSSGVSQFSYVGSQHLHFFSRSLIRPFASEEELWNLHHLYGASPKYLFNLYSQPAIYDDIVNEEINQLSPQDLVELLQNAANATDYSHFLISTGPLSIDRTRLERKVVSPHVLVKICNRVLKNQLEEIRKIYNTLRAKPTTAGAAGMIYESQVHRLLKAGRTIDLYHIRFVLADKEKNATRESYEAIGDGKYWKSFTIPSSTEFLFNKPPTSPQIGTYYRPQNTQCAAINPFLLIQPNFNMLPILLAFQMAISGDEYDAKNIDLDLVDKSVAMNAEKHLVIVTPSGVRPKINVPKGHLTEKFSRSRYSDLTFPIYHLQIDF